MLDSMPLAQYVAEHWIGHAKSGGVVPTVLQLVLCLFKSESAPLRNWVRMYDIDARGHKDLSMDAAEVCSALYYSSLAGMQEVSDCLLHRGENVNAKGGRLGNALQAASYEGYEAIVRLLLENRAEVNAKGGLYGNALQAASSRGNEMIVELLLKNGAEVNAVGGLYGNALQAAVKSYRNNVATVKLLLENGAEVNVKGGRYGNALQTAVFRGDEVIVKLLLENGADVNAEGGKLGNALQISLSRGNRAIMKLLLEKGAEMNVGGEYGSALQAALFSDEEIVKLLLDNGAEVTAIGGQYGNALQAALLRDDKAIMKLHTCADISNAVEDSDLSSMPYVKGAGMDTQKTCLEGTRNEILNEITAWINNTKDNTSIFWLHGNAGTGKSSIAHTIAYRFKKLGQLGSCYCLNRNEMAEQRDKNIFTTIARDLADHDKQIRRELVAAINHDTTLKNTTDILKQWKELIMKPAQKLSEAMVGPIVIVIDALDESGRADSRQHILRILSGKLDDDESHISKLPSNFRILLTSRPLPDIYNALNGIIHVQQKSIDSIPSSVTQCDILQYVSYELSGLKEIQSKEVLASLARASDGLFEWARLACAYIKGDDAGITVMERFELVITHNKDNYVPLLDSMYILTLETIFPPDQHMRRNRSIRLDRFRSVMAQILGTAEPLPLASLNTMRHQFAHVRKTDINTIIRPLGALLSGTTDPTATIQPLHASFPEFLMDENRSGEFFVDISHIHNDLAFASLGVMKDGLQFNICRLPTSYLPNSEIYDLAERVKKYISPELSYSCRFWTYHLRLTQFNLPLAEAVRGFFNDECLLFWLEVLSLLKTVNTCASWLSNVLQWVMVCTIALLFDIINVLKCITASLMHVVKISPML